MTPAHGDGIHSGFLGHEDTWFEIVDHEELPRVEGKTRQGRLDGPGGGFVFGAVTGPADDEIREKTGDFVLLLIVRSDDILFGMADHDDFASGELESIEQGEDSGKKGRHHRSGVFPPDLIADCLFFGAEAEGFGEEGAETRVIVDPEPILEGYGLSAATQAAHLFLVGHMVNNGGAVDGGVVMVYQDALIFHRVEP